MSGLTFNIKLKQTVHNEKYNIMEEVGKKIMWDRMSFKFWVSLGPCPIAKRPWVNSSQKDYIT